MNYRNDLFEELTEFHRNQAGVILEASSIVLNEAQMLRSNKSVAKLLSEGTNDSLQLQKFLDHVIQLTIHCKRTI